MVNINWCLTMKDGIRMTDPNQNLAEAFIKKAEESLVSMRENSVKEWKVTTAYYSMYFSLYAILNRIGINCEIHPCTIKFANIFLNDYFSDEEIDFLEESMNARVDTLYYTNKDVKDELYENMIKRAPQILIKCKDIINKIDENKINQIRKKVNEKILEIKNKKKSK